MPLGTLVQAPGEPVSAHDWQTPVQLVWQQICCEQKPDPHSTAVTQACPIPLRPHEPVLLQTAGDWQSPSRLQASLQTLTPHWYGKQGPALGVTHFPAPSQAEAAGERRRAAGQVEPMQVVPAT